MTEAILGYIARRERPVTLLLNVFASWRLTKRLRYAPEAWPFTLRSSGAVVSLTCFRLQMTPRRPDSARCESRKWFDGSVHGGKVENVGKPLRKSPAQLMEICLEKPHPSVDRRSLPPSASITYLTELTLTALLSPSE
jgi:hypothetical protein